MILTISGFLTCALLIFYSGIKLARYGDQIAEATGMSKAWFGLIMMASVTSLPELFVGISSAAFVGSADFAVGDVLGSCAFNLAILTLLDAFSKKNNLLGLASPSHVLAASLGIILFALVGISIYLPADFKIIEWIGYSSILFIAVYIFSIKLVYQYEKKNATVNLDFNAENGSSIQRLSKIITLYIVNALVVIGSAMAIPYFAEQLADQFGMGKSFVGTLLLAGSTSLPEVAVSLAAIRLAAVDMAIGNLLGSNLFNIFILALDGFFYQKGNLLKDASEKNIVTVFFVIIMTAIAIVGLTYRSPEKRYLLAWDTLLIIVMYIANMIIIFQI